MSNPDFLSGLPLNLAPKEIEVLELLHQNPKGLKVRDAVEAVYGSFSDLTYNAFRVHVSRVNRKCDEVKLDHLIEKGGSGKPYRYKPPKS